MKRPLTALPGEIASELGDNWLPKVYAEKVRSGRTRSFRLDVPARENKPEIFHTLLGIELKVGSRRFACPDLPTARYLRIFARMGCSDVAVPYDITQISAIADELETAWHQALLLLDKAVKGSEPSVIGRARSALVRKLREEIDASGPGEAMPVFNTPTRQRDR